MSMIHKLIQFALMVMLAIAIPSLEASSSSDDSSGSSSSSGLPAEGSGSSASGRSSSSCSAGSDDAEILLFLSSLEGGRRIPSRMRGQQYSNIVIQAEFANHQFIQRLYNPLRGLTTTTSCCFDKYGDPRDDDVWDIWFDVSYVRNFVNGRKRGAGYNGKGFELSLGVQQNFDCNYTVGGAISYEFDHFEYNLGGTGNGYNVFGGLYSLYRQPNDYYFLVDLIVGFNEQKLKRRFRIEDWRFKMHARPSIIQASLYAEAAKDLRWNCLLLQPFLGLEGGFFYRRKISERGHCDSSLLDLSLESKSRGAASSRLGVHFTATPIACLSVTLDLAWSYRLTAYNNDIRGHLRGLDREFTAKGTTINRNSFDGALNMTANVIDGLDFYMEFYGQNWKQAKSYSVLWGLQAIW